MSQLGKILLIVALAGALVAGVFGWLLISNYDGAKATLATTQTAKDAADKEAAKQKALAEAAKAAQTDAETKLADANTQVSDMKTKLADAQKSADDATKALSDATGKADKATADLKAITDQLGSDTVDSLKAAKTKAETDLAAAESDKKIMQDQLTASLAQVEQLKVDINNSHNGGVMPPGISGKVTYVNRTWNFVVLNVGLSNGVVPNGELIIFRNNTFLGKVKVTSAEATTAVADILPDVKGDIQKGDSVLN